MNTDQSPDRAVAAVAAAQHTIVTREQLLACGLGPKAIVHRLRAGRLHVVFRGVYAVGCGELPPLAKEQAAILVCGDGAFLSHLSAAYLWGLWPVCPTEVNVSLAGRYVADRDGLDVHRIQGIDPSELGQTGKLPISSPARALLEIAGGLSTGEVERTFDEAIRLRLVDVGAVRAVLARNPARRGAKRLIGLLDLDPAMAMTRSGAERRFLALVRRAGVSRPDVNVALGRFVVDFLWREERIVVEIDGFGFHAGRRSFESDRRRDVELQAAGFTVLRFTWRQLLHEPEVVLVRLGQVMALSLRSRAG